VEWTNPVARTLEMATLEVEPPHAFRALRVRRADGDLLANESWGQDRSRGVRVWPASLAVAEGEPLRLEAVAWWDTPVTLTAILKWRKDGPNGR
jgi:hypothetical protein